MIDVLLSIMVASAPIAIVLFWVRLILNSVEGKGHE